MIEQRRTPRLYEPISVTVRGDAGKGKNFEFETIANDVSGGGLCAFAPQPIRPGTRLSFQVRFARAGTRPFYAPTVATKGIVLRVKDLPDGTCMFAAAFTMRGVV